MTAAVLREVRLYGRLGAQFGRVFRLAVATPSEAVRALCAVLPGFKAAFLGDEGLARYHVFVGRGTRREVIPAAAKDDLVDVGAPIRIVPAVEGSKRAGLGQTILGAVLWVAGAYIELWGAFGGGGPLAVGVGEWMRTIGTAMMIGGVVQMLSPQRTQSSSSSTQNSPSYGMDAGAINETDSGTPVPIAYGRIICGSTQISGGLVTDNLGTAPTHIGGGGGGGGIGGGGTLAPLSLPDYMDRYPVDGGSILTNFDYGAL